jgi:hypothetical protein
VTTLTVVHTALFSQRGNLTEKRHEKAIYSDLSGLSQEKDIRLSLRRHGVRQEPLILFEPDKA